MAHQQQQQRRQGLLKKSSDLVVSRDDWEGGVDVDIGGNPSFEEHGVSEKRPSGVIGIGIGRLRETRDDRKRYCLEREPSRR